MLSYRHGFHAGGWADVHKHVALSLLLARLRLKRSPFTVVDVYAGDALYDLGSPQALKTKEYEGGIARLIAESDPPAGIGNYLDVVRGLNPPGTLKRYPGSPALARALLREGDRMIANELHPTAYRSLASWAKGDPRIAVHKRDALEFLGWVATPKLRRGLVVIDPAYEVKAEYTALPKAVAYAVKNWPQGIYALWYPVLLDERHRAMLAALAHSIGTLPGIDALVSEITPPDAQTAGMRAAGLVVINPPWGFEAGMAEAGAWLARGLWAPREGRHVLHSLLSQHTRAGAAH